MAFHHSPRIVSDGLVFCMDIPNTKCYPGSGTVLTDLIEEATGNVSNATIVTGVQGHMSFDGSGDSIAFPSTIEMGTTSYTIVFWFKTDAVDTGGYGYFVKNKTVNQGGFAIDEGGGVIGAGKLYYYDGSSASTLSTTALSTGVWHHIAFDVNSSTDVVNTYINGALHKTTSTSVNYTTGFEKLGWNGGAHYLGGDMAHVAFYNRQLSATEVLQNYTALKGRYE